MPHEETGKFIADGNTRPGGKLPLNTNGGGLSYMHSGMYGMYALQESVRQMRGIAPAQVPGAKSRSATASAACSRRQGRSFLPTKGDDLRHSGMVRMLTAIHTRNLEIPGSRFARAPE